MNELKPVSWHTEDHTDDFSATTYDEGLAEHWKKKGWPVTPMFYAIPDTHRVVSVDLLRTAYKVAAWPEHPAMRQIKEIIGEATKDGK